MKLKAKISIDKSFDKSTEFSKDWQDEDFETFFREEGKYLDKLAIILKERGKVEDNFTVTYTVKVVNRE